MFNLQGSEIIFILLLALVVLGPEKLPGAIRRFTRTYAELRKMGTSFQQEVKTAFDEPMREVRETADLIKQQVDVDAIEAEHDAGQTGASTTTELPDVDVSESPAANADAGVGQHPDTAYRPLQPPVAGTARPGPQPGAEPGEPTPPAAPTGPTEIPPPPAPFSSSRTTTALPEAAEPHPVESGSTEPADEGAASS